MVLCSVADQSKVLGEIKRLLNKNGGIFGYIEHVAARTEVLLGLQQVIFDPIQVSAPFFTALGYFIAHTAAAIIMLHISSEIFFILCSSLLIFFRVS